MSDEYVDDAIETGLVSGASDASGALSVPSLPIPETSDAISDATPEPPSQTKPSNPEPELESPQMATSPTNTVEEQGSKGTPVPLTPKEQAKLDAAEKASTEAKDNLAKFIDPAGLYRFIGTGASIGQHRLTDYGTQIKISDPEMLVDAVAGGVGLVAESEWDKLGFTEEELNAHPKINQMDHNTEPDFMRKYLGALKAKHGLQVAALAVRHAETEHDSTKRFYTNYADERRKRSEYEAMVLEHDPEHPFRGRYVHWQEMLVGPGQNPVQVPEGHDPTIYHNPESPFKKKGNLIINGVLK